MVLALPPSAKWSPRKAAISTPRGPSPRPKWSSPPSAGYVQRSTPKRSATSIINLGGGRKQLGDKLDLSTGLEMLVRLGDQVSTGQPLVKMFAGERGRDSAKRMIQQAITIGEEQVSPPPLIAERIV